MLQLQPITPVLVYDDIRAAHEFLVDVFGFESGGVTIGADGRPVHGEVPAGTLRSGFTALVPNTT
jgi:uncharacterized glyoxalase superfamily protein PhnB